MGLLGWLFGKGKEEPDKTRERHEEVEDILREMRREEMRNPPDSDDYNDSRNIRPMTSREVREMRKDFRVAHRKDVIARLNHLSHDDYLTREEKIELMELDREARYGGYMPPEGLKFDSRGYGFIVDNRKR